MGSITAELHEGLAEAWPYLLSHHQPAEYHRCYSPAVGGRPVHICARCLGIYPGIVVGLFTPAGGVATPVGLVALAALPALLDWALTTFTHRTGFNIVRTATGALLGWGYGLGLTLLLFHGRLAVVGIGVLYAVLAAVLLARSV